MRVFLRFGDAQILEIEVGEDVGEDVFQFFGREDVAQPRPGLFVLRHGDVHEIFRPRGIGELLEAGLDEGAGHLAGAVGAEVEEDRCIVVVNGAARHGGFPRRGLRGDHHGNYEFVRDASSVAPLHGGDRIAKL